MKHEFFSQRETVGINIAAVSILQKGLSEVAQNDFSNLFSGEDGPRRDFDPFKPWSFEKTITASIN